MAVRMKDIAKELGLSVVTVSKVLRNHPDISEKTRNRVLAHVRERDYQPNVLARSLVTGRSFLIALVVPSLIHPFFAEVAKALSQTIRPMGYSLLISTSEEDSELESREIRQLVARQVDALVIASTSTSGELFEHLRKTRQVFVLIDRDFRKVPCNFVGANDVTIGEIATEHLIQMGCKRIAHIGGRKNEIGISRLRGYRRALRKNGVPVNDAYVIDRSNLDIDSVQQGADAVRKLLALKERPDGIFCFNDPLAVGAMDELLSAGLRIPEDIAIIGCGNLHYDKSLRVPLSSVDQHSQLIGEWAGKIVLKLIESKTLLPPQRVLLQPSIVARSSTALPSNSKAKKKC
jgi:LacI family transcriptional regulator